MNWYDEELYDVVRGSIEKQKEQLEQQERLIKEQQSLMKQLENVIFFKKERKNELV